METRMIKLRNENNLFQVEMLHPRYGWIRVNDSPLSLKCAEHLQKRMEKWEHIPAHPKTQDWVRKSRLYLDEIESLNHELRRDMSPDRRGKLEERRRKLLEYTIVVLGDRL